MSDTFAIETKYSDLRCALTPAGIIYRGNYEDITIDARNSYDPNDPEQNVDELTFNWTCYYIEQEHLSPNECLNSLTGDPIIDDNNRFKPVLFLQAGSFDLNDYVQIDVSVSSDKGSRECNDFVRMHIEFNQRHGEVIIYEDPDKPFGKYIYGFDENIVISAIATDWEDQIISNLTWSVNPYDISLSMISPKGSQIL